MNIVATSYACPYGSQAYNLLHPLHLNDGDAGVVELFYGGEVSGDLGRAGSADQDRAQVEHLILVKEKWYLSAQALYFSSLINLLPLVLFVRVIIIGRAFIDDIGRRTENAVLKVEFYLCKLGCDISVCHNNFHLTVISWLRTLYMLP